MGKTNNKVTQNNCAINLLITYKIENFNIISKNAIKFENILKQNWLKLNIYKSIKKVCNRGCYLFVKLQRPILNTILIILEGSKDYEIKIIIIYFFIYSI